jgi:hypothetical protein
MDVSEEYITSIFRVEKHAKLESSMKKAHFSVPKTEVTCSSETTADIY